MDNKTVEILERFQRQIVFHRQYKHAFSLIENAIENTQILRVPVCALLCGVSGSGKSTLCRYIEKYHSSDPVVRREDGTYLNLPVFYCEVPSPTTVLGLIQRMLKALIGEEINGTIGKLTHQLVTCLATARVKVIFLDEIQLLCLTTVSQKVKLDALQWIVSLLNNTGIAIILSGTELCRDIRKSHAPFANRYPYFAELTNFTYENNKDSDYFTVLQQLDSVMYSIAELENGVHLNDPTVASALFVASSGNLKIIRLIINDALKNCLMKEGQRELKVDDFYMACVDIDLQSSLTNENPFTLELRDTLILISNYQESRS